MGNTLTIPDYENVEKLQDLEKIIIFLKKAVSEGLLNQYWDNQYVGVSKEKIEDIDTYGSYPDNIIMNFTCPSTGKNYELSVDVYHGSGGEWTVLD